MSMRISAPPRSVATTLLTVLVALVGTACDKPYRVVFDREDDIIIDSREGAPLPAVIVKTQKGKVVTKGVTPTITVSPEGIVSTADGKLTPLKNGEATLTASAPGLKSATVDVKVDVIDAVKLNCPSPCVVAVGSRVLITANAESLGARVDKPLEWKSSKPAVATVDAGTVTGVSSGTATITATAGAKTTSIDVTVLPGLDELRLFCPNPAFVIVEKKGAPPPATKPPPCQITQGGSAKLLLLGAKGNDVFTPPVTWSSSSTSSLLIIDGEISARDVGSATVSAVVGDLKVEMPIEVVSGRVDQCTDPLGYGIEANTALTVAAQAKFDFMCASPSAADCVKAAVAEVDKAQAPAELMQTLTAHAMSEHARRCCCKPK